MTPTEKVSVIVAAFLIITALLVLWSGRKGTKVARIRVCGVCFKPVRECICVDDEPQDDDGADAA